jgi:formamidopyrimidine-DNA glycosylase
MPELPEVETVRRGLQDILAHKPVLKKIELRRPDLRYDIPVKKIRSLEGQAILSVGRRAKYLWFETSKGYLVSHLGMTGSWRIADRDYGTHDHVILHFANELSLVFRDPRRFWDFRFQ